MKWPEYIYGEDEWPDEVDASTPPSTTVHMTDGRTLNFGPPAAVFADGKLIWHDPEQTKAAFAALVESCAEVKAIFENFAREVARGFAKSLAHSSLFQPSLRYAMAGSPYGRNRKGKKKWLLEQKRARRSTY